MQAKGKGQESIFTKIVSHPWKVIGACILLMAFVGSYMRYVAPSVSYKDMLGEDYPLLKVYEKIQREYTNDDNLLVLIEAREGDTFTKDILSGVKNLTKELWKTPYSIRVDSVANFQHIEADGDDLKVADLVGAESSLSPERIQAIKRIALSEPLLLNRAVNKRGNVLAINVSFAFPNVSAEEKISAASFVQEAVDIFKNKHSDTNAYVAGLVALDATVMTISSGETGLFLLLTMLIVVGLLVWILRAYKPVLVSVMVFVFSIVAGMAFSGMMGWKLTPFTASVPMMILILAVADCVHYITSFTQRLRSGEEKREALINSLRLNFSPIVITSVTTAIGFLTLNFSESGSIRALGNQVAFGVMVALLLSITFLPAVLSVLPFKSGSPDQPRKLTRYSRIVDQLYKNRLALLSASIVFSATLCYCITENTFDDNLPSYFAKTLPWRQANDFGEEQFGGAYTFSYSLNSGTHDGVANPAFIRDVEKFASWLRTLPEVAYVNSVSDTFKRLNRSMHGGNEEYYRIPEDRELAAQYLLLYEMSLPYGLDLNDQINMDKSATKVLATFRTMSTTQVLAMENRINNWLKQNLTGIQATGSGVQMMFAHLLNQDTRGLTMGAGFGLLVISLLLIVAFRSFKIGLLSVIPNILPVVSAFGIWGIFVGQIGMGLAMVSGITIGIVVDDTVHFLSKYLKGRREKGFNARDSVAYAFENVGPSIVFTTVVLVAGFVAMAALSEFRVNSDMGKMTATILTFALAFDLVTLPVLLMIFDTDKAPQEEAALNTL